MNSACELGHEDVIKLLLEDHRVDIVVGKDRKYPPFFRAVKQGHVRVVKIFLTSDRVIDIVSENPAKEASKKAQRYYSYDGESEEVVQNKKAGYAEIADSLALYQADPAGAKVKFWRDLGQSGQLFFFCPCFFQACLDDRLMSLAPFFLSSSS